MKTCVAIFSVVLLLVACGAPTGGVGATTSSATSSGTNTTLDHPASELATAKELWAAAALDTYHFMFENDCGECPPDMTEPREVVVTGGDSGPEEPTIDSLFEDIQRALDEGTPVEVSYDPVLGYPTEIWIDKEARAYDGGTHWLIRDLTAGESAPSSS